MKHATPFEDPVVRSFYYECTPRFFFGYRCHHGNGMFNYDPRDAKTCTLAYQFHGRHPVTFVPYDVVDGYDIIAGSYITDLIKASPYDVIRVPLTADDDFYDRRGDFVPEMLKRFIIRLSNTKCKREYKQLFTQYRAFIEAAVVITA